MIIKTEKHGTVTIYHVKKDKDARMNTFIKPKDIQTIITEDADVYTEEGKCLLRFRKNALKSKRDIDAFYENIIDFAKNVSSNRGNATGSKTHELGTNPKVMSNIFGFFDRWGPSNKMVFKRLGKTPKLTVRECRFNRDHPEQYKQTLPLIQDIDRMYQKLVPDKYKLQRKKADETYFKIPHTSFTTITTNLNYQTSIHTDRGDDDEGFGNLAVIDQGEYTGAETCFPEYGIGVDVRRGDILFMDVHQPHANLPMVKKDPDAKRLSIVCYLRKGVWKNTRNKTKKVFEQHNRTVKYMMTRQKTRKNRG